METIEYRKLLSILDSQIEEAKKTAEEKARREALEQHLKLINHQIEQLETRRAEIERLGIQSNIDLPRILAQLAVEKETLDRQLLPPAQPKLPARMPPEDRAQMEALYEEIMRTPVESLEAAEAWAQFEVWAVRWRIVAEHVGEEVAYSDGFLKMCFARIRDRMAACKEQGPYIDALDRTAKADWPARLKASEERLHRAIEERRRMEEAERAVDLAVQDLTVQIKSFQDAGPGADDRALRHHVRNAAKYEHLRDDLAEMLLPVREKLGEEFAFLWKNGQPEPEEKPEEPRRMTNQEILTRIIRRLNSKKLIGAAHGPWDKIYQGFPEHDKGRAKECMEVLVKAGILRRKPSIIGPRISIEPKMLGYVEAAITGRPMGVSAVDEWCAKEA